MYSVEVVRKDGSVRVQWIAEGPGEWVFNDGKRKRDRPKGKGRTQTEAVRNLNKSLERRQAGIVAAPDLATVGAWLDYWLETTVKGHKSDNTYENYRIVVEKHLKPGLGSALLSELTPEQVDEFLAHKAIEGRLDVLSPDGREKLRESGRPLGLSRSYVNRMKVILAAALKHAERRRKVSHNAAGLAVMPVTERPEERRALTSEEKERFLAAAKDDRLEALVVVGFELGLRPGELTGLLWTDLELDSQIPVLRVSGSMKYLPDGSRVRGPVKKSRRGVRSIKIPSEVQRILKAHKARQASEKLTAREAWFDPNLVFASEVGTPLDLSNLRKTFARFALAAALKDVYPYTARHTCASLLLEDGFSVEQVAQLLGDDAQTIYRYYHHPVSSVVTLLTDPRRASFLEEGGDRSDALSS